MKSAVPLIAFHLRLGYRRFLRPCSSIVPATRELVNACRYVMLMIRSCEFRQQCGDSDHSIALRHTGHFTSSSEAHLKTGESCGALARATNLVYVPEALRHYVRHTEIDGYRLGVTSGDAV